MSIYSQRDSNIRKTWLLFTVFLVIVIGIGWFISYVYQNQLILIIAVLFSVVMSITSYWYSDKIVLAMSRAHLIEKKNAPELYNIVENLAITAGLPMPRVYLIDDAAPNAFATGRNPEHAVVAVTRGLLEKLDRSELEGVLAHELSHIGNRDILLSTVVVVLVGFVSLISDFFLRSLFWRGLGGRDRDSGQVGAILMLIGIVMAVLAPIAAVLMQLAISRKREFLADASAALLTRYPRGLASALEKISKDQTPLRVANNTTAHLFIASPFKGRRAKSWLAKLFMTHPPIEERITRLKQMSI